MKRIVPIFLVTVLLLSGCSSQKNEQAKKEAHVETKTIKPIYIMAGRIEANEKVDITSKVQAKVSEIMVDVGSKVSEGDPIIKLDTQDLEDQVRQAEAGVSIAEANLAKVLSGARPEQKVQAQAALDSASKNYENVKNNYDRINQLVQNGVASKQQLETIEGQLATAQGQYKSTKEQMNMLNNGETKETINIVKAQVNQAKAALNLAQTHLSNGMILSPVSGVVSEKNINKGEMASTNNTLISVVGTDLLIVNAYLPGRLVDKVKVGQEVVIKVSEIPEKTFQGHISVINPVIDVNSKTILVKVSIKNKDVALKQGMFAEIGLKM
ncbi:efflux RND transporter periplasmic adaptor subunit [Lutibacter sp. B2]|nr:efflux RND transporter periplasmic adaptor subunit [Lutibacter sp. B2]